MTSWQKKNKGKQDEDDVFDDTSSPTGAGPLSNGPSADRRGWQVSRLVG